MSRAPDPSAPLPRARADWAWLAWLAAMLAVSVWLLADLWPWVADPQRVPFRSRQLYGLPEWAAWFWLLPAVAWAQQQLSFGEARWRVSLPVQLTIGGVVVPALFFALEAARQLASNHLPLSDAGLLAREQWRAGQWGWEPAFIYAGLAAGFYALDYYRQWREEARRGAELVLAQARAETRAAEAELHALKQQLQPHFLFNALNSAAMFMRGGEVESAADMLAHVGALLRSLLDTSRQQDQPFGAELEFARHYLAVERMRFGDRLAVHYDVAAECLAVRVPSLLLQPLVENALKHGVARRSEPTRIEVRAARASGDFVLEVSNDTAEPLPPGNDAARVHVGLRNTRERLARVFGATYALETSFVPGERARVIVRFPWPPGARLPL